MVLQKEFVGVGCIEKVETLIKETKSKKILLVTGKQSYITSNAKDKLDIILRNIYVEQFSQFDVNPNLDDVYTGLKLFKNIEYDLVIAIGGGSVIDMAKLINILSAQKNSDILRYIKDSKLISEKGAPLVAIPTTYGTGSETTHFAVVYVNNTKYSLAHPFIMPCYSIVDPDLSCALPKHIAAASGMDALSQAVESYWSVKSTRESKKYASEAIVLIVDAIQDAVEGEEYAKKIMPVAAHLAGKAINITTTTAPHAISYPITSKYGLQHGHAVALTLGKFFEINYQCSKNKLNDTRGVAKLNKTMDEIFSLMGVTGPSSCEIFWYSLMDRIGLEYDINKIGIRKDTDIRYISNNVNLERLDNHPVKITKKDIWNIFYELK